MAGTQRQRVQRGAAATLGVNARRRGLRAECLFGLERSACRSFWLSLIQSPCLRCPSNSVQVELVKMTGTADVLAAWNG